MIVLSGYSLVNQVSYNSGPLSRYLVIYMGNLEILCAFLMSMVHLQLPGTLRKSLDYYYFFRRKKLSLNDITLAT